MIDLGDIIERPIDISGPSDFLDIIRTFTFLKDRHSWVAGGAALRLARGMTDLPAGGPDIDIFCQSYQHRNDVLAKLKGMAPMFAQGEGRGFKQFSYSHHRETGDDNFQIDSIPVQLIDFDFYPTLDDLFESFDFTVCMFATDGYTLRAPELAWEDLAARRMRVYNEKPRKTMKRVSKYAALGFTPVPGTLRKMFDTLPDGYTFDSEKMTIHAPANEY